MTVYILTHGRETWAQQHTAKQFKEADIPFRLVVQESRVPLWSKAPQYRSIDVLVLPQNVTDVSATRDYLIHKDHPVDFGGGYVLMFDDDLQFAVRRTDAMDKFRQPTTQDLLAMIQAMEDALEEHPMVGLGAREGGNRNTEPILYNTRMMRALGFRRSFMREKHITFAPMDLMEDFHVNLQILRAGFDTCVLNMWVTNQAGGSNAPGGCSLYRTEALQTASAHKLARLHPGFVKAVQKPAWSGDGERTDVTVQWKAARRSAP